MGVRGQARGPRAGAARTDIIPQKKLWNYAAGSTFGKLFSPPMRLRSSPADLLLSLSRQTTSEDQQASFRQALTALAHSGGEMGPPPLDGVDARSVEAAAFLALERGLFNKLDFLRPGPAAVALYELSAACSPGNIKRELRRRVFSLLFEGDASAFLPVATRIALGGAGPLSSQPLRARVALCLDLPFGSEQNVAPLALALATRSSTREDWLMRPSRLALPGRRMAAQLLEHASREAVFRFQLGDVQPRNLLLGRELRPVFLRLLGDREPLVWRHAAVARGLLAAIDPETRMDVEQVLAPSGNVTQWRRGMVSLVASMVLGDQEAHSSVHAVLGSSLPKRDPGLPAAIVAGLGRVIEAEPDRAENLVERLAMTERTDVCVALADLLLQVKDPDFAKAARESILACLRRVVDEQDPVLGANVLRAQRSLTGELASAPDLSAHVQAALCAFEEVSARRAYDLALEAVAEAHVLSGFVEESSSDEETAPAVVAGKLLDLDRGAFQRPVLSNLLLLGRRPGAGDARVEQLERLQNRVSRWILSGLDEASSWSRQTTAFDQQRLRMLLHLVDAERTDLAEASGPLTERVQQSILVLLDRLAKGPDPAVHRVLCAALARCFDAAVRDGINKASDLVLVVAMLISDHESVATIADASTAEDVASPLSALAAFINPERRLSADAEGRVRAAMLSDLSGHESEEVADKVRVVAKIMELSQGIVGGGGYHAEALRRVFFRLGRALEAIAAARGQSELVDLRDAGPPVLEELERSADDLLHMIRCAQRRVLGGETDRPSSDYGGPGLRALIEHALTVDENPDPDQVARATEALVLGLPEPIGAAILHVAFRIPQLPRAGASSVARAPLALGRAPLPNWLLPRRTIGSFYVVRPLGTGGVSSVFVARRLEDKNDSQAEAFALKVPEYDPATARSMSEEDFFQMFREEAGALLSLPAHENLARFVTFDLSARPKPILVMELIRGATLDRLVRSRSLTMPRVASYLLGILHGLSAMHRAGLGHLDVKATNVILRDGKTPVLVDFGLSGRHLRPGCGTVEYTSPEVLGVAPDGYQAAPPAADVYSFGCLAYELVTGSILFQAPDEMTLITRHVSHDGWLPQLAQLNEVPALGRFARVVAACLRHDPRERLTASQLLDKLPKALEPLSDMSWPLALPVAAQAG